MDSESRIIKAKVKLQTEQPFFAYLVMNLKMIEKKDIGTMGVDNRGNCYYNSEFIESLDDNELKGVLTHEVMHIILEHLVRGSELEHQFLMNVSCDMVVNDILVENDFSLPQKVFIPYNHECKFNNITISEIDKKTAIQIYHELLSQMEKQKQKSKSDQEDSDGQDQEDSDEWTTYEGFDKHITTDKTKETNEQISKQRDKWKNTLAEGTMFAKQRGKIPRGMELMIDELLNPKVNWKTMLYKYITSVIPFDYTYNRPSKRSISCGSYMPSILRESVEIVVSIDTSGSISKTELTEFMTEINQMLTSFSNVNIKLIVCDSEIKDVFSLGNGQEHNIEDIIFRGGGGTSHLPVYDYIKENLPNTQFLINFTDGYTDFPDDEEIKTLWVLCSGSCDDDNIPFGEIIRL